MQMHWNKILVPYDFSTCADHALGAAIELAKKFDSSIHVLTVLDIPGDWLVLTEEERDAFPRARKLIDKATEGIQAKIQEAERRGVVLNWEYSGGRVIDRIRETAEVKHSDLIVMGSHGSSGKNEYFIGSNTQKVIRAVHVPVLVVKSPLKSAGIKRMAYASSFDMTEKEAFERFLSFARPFEPEIHLVAVNTSGFFSQPYVVTRSAMDDFCTMCRPLECHTHFFSDLTVESGIRHFTNKIDADLVAISNHARRPVARLFSGSKVETLANHADIPVLSIDFEKDKTD